MPEAIAVYKLQAFVEEIGGTIVEASSGRVRIHLKVHRNALQPPGGLMSWLGLTGKTGLVELDLQMKARTGKTNVLKIAIFLRPADGSPVPTHAEWRSASQLILTTLKSYLMTHT